MKAKHIVFKVGTSSLTNLDGSLSRAKVKEITRQLALLHEAGHELILISSEAIAAGFSSLLGSCAGISRTGVWAGVSTGVSGWVF